MSIYNIWRELGDKLSIISYFCSTFYPNLGYLQGRIYYKSDVSFACTFLLCKNEHLYCCNVVMYIQKLHHFCNTSSPDVGQDRNWEIINYWRLINQFPPNITRSIRQFKRINKKYVDKKCLLCSIKYVSMKKCCQNMCVRVCVCMCVCVFWQHFFVKTYLVKQYKYLWLTIFFWLSQVAVCKYFFFFLRLGFLFPACWASRISYFAKKDYKFLKLYIIEIKILTSKIINFESGTNVHKCHYLLLLFIKRIL